MNKEMLLKLLKFYFKEWDVVINFRIEMNRNFENGDTSFIGTPIPDNINEWINLKKMLKGITK